MPKPKLYQARLWLRLTDGDIAKLDSWRGNAMTRSEAIRQAIRRLPKLVKPK